MQSFTINKSISLSGIGLHSGVNSNIILKPSEINSGIYFNRTDKDKIIPAQWNNVISTKFSTNIGKDDVEVKTVEHLLSALAGLHINNCEISIDNIEVPILDGSSKIFVEEIQKVGVLEQSNKQNILEILKNEGYIKDYFIEKKENNKTSLKISLKYYEGDPVIKEIKRISKPGRRVYSRAISIPKVMNGLGLAILSTPKGVMSDAEARKNNVGGEIICKVF